MRNLVLSLASIVGFGFMSVAGAVPVSSQSCAPAGDNRTIAIDPGLACIAKGEGNNSNNATFLAAVSSYSLIGTEEDGVNASQFNADVGSTSGTLTFTQNLWNLYSEILVVLKTGVAKGQELNPDWALFSLESGFTTYNWSITPPQGGALSHISLYGRSSTQVPEPATLGLLGLGLLGVAGVRRRRRA